MPRLGSFLVCEKIILDQQQKPTLIEVFQKVTAMLPQGQTMPKDTLSGNAWSIFCEWFFTEDEMRNRFEQVMEVVAPDGTKTPVQGRLPFREISPDPKTGTRTYMNIFGLPISQTGHLTVNVWLESNLKRVTEVFSYHISIEHVQGTGIPGDGGIVVPALTQAKPS